MEINELLKKFPYILDGFEKVLMDEADDEFKALVLGFEWELKAALQPFRPPDWEISLSFFHTRKPVALYKFGVTVWTPNVPHKDKISRTAAFYLTSDLLRVEMWRYDGPKIGGAWSNPATSVQKTVAEVVKALGKP